MKVAIYCNNLNQLSFFLRFVDALESNGHQLVFWSNRLSVVLTARSRGQKAVLLSGYAIGDTKCLSFDSKDWYREQRGLLPVEKSRKRVKRYIASAVKFIEKYKPDALWLWNGTNQTCQTLVDVCNSRKIQTLFFEIGNFPGKLFVDTQGVNCRSWYASHRNQLRDLAVDLQSFREWKSRYLASKLDSHIVPQAKRVSMFNYHYLEDLFGFWFCGAITVELLAPVWKTTDFIMRRFFQLPLDDFSPENSQGFIFFPLQVSTDSQVLWNCDLAQGDALRKVAGEADREGLILVVKPHPAEPHWSALSEIIALKNELGFKLVGGNTFLLLQHCSRVVTLNSTVGLEAMLLDKPVQILGQAHYDGFDELDMAIYLQNYLLDIDCFSDEDIIEEQFDEIMQRVKFGCKN